MSRVEPGTPAVEVRGLEKRFEDVTALAGLDLDVPRGAFYALLGPNGAGKSTTLSILTGLVRPDGGSVRVLGLDALARPIEVKARIGVVPEELALFERLTGLQYLTFAGRMYGLSGPVAEARADELLDLTGLAGRASGLVGEYSKGMRRRLAIAAALIHAPELVFLDEPFEGIDVMASGVIRELLLELTRRRVTVVLTTHVLEIADRMATHAGIIRAGRIVDQGPAEALCARHDAADLEGVFGRLVGRPAAADAQLSFYGPAPEDAPDPGPPAGDDPADPDGDPPGEVELG